MIKIITLTVNYSERWVNHAHGRPVFGYFWSLVVEEQFYLALPLLFIFFRSLRAKLLVVIFGILIVIGLRTFWTDVVPEKQLFYYYRAATHSVCDALFIGVVLALSQRFWLAWLRKIPHMPLTLTSWALLFAIWFIPALNWRENDLDPWRFGPLFVVLELLSGGVVVIATMESGVVLSCGNWLRKSLAFLGSRSYGLYLFHLPVINLISEYGMAFTEILAPDFHARHLKEVNGVVTVIGLAFCVFIVELLYRLVELPLIRYGARLSHGVITRFLGVHPEIEFVTRQL
jgi:peptidoglycan/LPS O-acetylase OafA/YrhL